MFPHASRCLRASFLQHLRNLELRDFSPFVRKELRFDAYPRQPGGRLTLTAIVGANAAVWLTWQVAGSSAEAGDEAMLGFMTHNFMGTNHETFSPWNWHRIFLSSFSHMSFGHIMGNMTAFLVMAPKLHDFLGRGRFLALCAAGAVGGTVATDLLHLDPTWEEHEVAMTPKRYFNILNGTNPGQAVGLGASDIVAAMFACFYLTFPRQPVPFVFSKINLAWKIFPQQLRSKLPLVDGLISRTNAAAIWILPGFFLTDFEMVWKSFWGHNLESGLMPTTNTGHAAHVGGFLFGAGFYALVAHRMKAQYFQFTLGEAARRLYIMSLSLGFWYGLSCWTGKAAAAGEATRTEEKSLLLFSPKFDKEESGEGGRAAGATSAGLRALWGEGDSRLRKLVGAACACSLLESCRQAPREGKCGRCDEPFRELHAFLAAEAAAPRAAMEALQPEFCNATKACRFALRESPPSLGAQIHQGYRELPPALGETMLEGRRGFRSLREAGVQVVQQGTRGLTVAGVAPNSAAERAGVRAFIGGRLTHIERRSVQTESQCMFPRPVRAVHLWLEKPLEQGPALAGSAAAAPGGRESHAEYSCASADEQPQAEAGYEIVLRCVLDGDALLRAERACDDTGDREPSPQ